ncbi:MAG: ABC transporter permease [Clostridia bacterium]|nr:ABC transporter permease [Clostridia bacterium]
MKTLLAFIRRNVKVFFKDKGMFFTSLITPLILLVLYATFLSKVYKESFMTALPGGFTIPEKLLNGTVTCQMTAALLAVSSVTVSFCSNLLMISDKAIGTVRDFTVSPVKKSVMALGYYISSAVTTLTVSFTALALCFVYLAFQGWYLTISDVILVIADVCLLTLFGTALSSCINFFLSTNGQASAVGTIVSTGYGFLCGAYMPIATFSDSLQRVLMFLPGTYGTSLLRNHLMRGVFAEMESIGFPGDVMTEIRDSIDCNLYFGDTSVSVFSMAIILTGSILLFTGLFVTFNMFIKRKEK